MLKNEYDDLRDAINDCAGYRILWDDETLLPTDETTCASLILSDYGYSWDLVGDDWGSLDKPVEWHNSSASSDMDASERLFRRKVDGAGH